MDLDIEKAIKIIMFQGFIINVELVKFCKISPAWGSLDILEACGASDSGSNPDAGVLLNITVIQQ